MYQIVYLSSAVETFSEDELRQILIKSRRNNEKAGVTGILLYHDGSIIQVLEGNKEEVLNTFKRIEKDYRHRGIITLLDRAIEQRVFPDWSMGFKAITSGEYSQLIGYLEPNKILNLTEGEAFATNEVVTLLQSFATLNMPGYSNRG